MPTDPRSIITAVAVTALIAFGMYRRVRRTIGRQPLQKVRIGLRMGIYAVIGAVVLTLHPALQSFEAAAVGALAGVILGFYGLRHTLFESTPDGRFYTPNIYIGLGVTALLISRIAYRFVTAGFVPPAAAHPGPPQNGFDQFVSSPLTLGLFFVVAGYYLFYYGGVLRRLQEPVTAAENMTGPENSR